MHERGIGFAREHPVGDVGHRLRVQAVAAHWHVRPTLANRRNRLPCDAHRGVHRDRDRDAVGPIGQRRIPRLGRQVETADVVAPIAQTRGRRGHVQRLVPELVAGNEQNAHYAMTAVGCTARTR